MKISDVKSVGELFDGFLMIKDVVVAKTRKQVPYLALTFADNSGTIRANYWDATPELIQQYQAQTIVKVEAEVQFYEGLQFKILRMRTATDQDDVSLKEFVKAAPISKEELWTELEGYLLSIGTKSIRDIVTHVLRSEKERFEMYPAASKNHHAFISGLLYHTVSMARTATALCRVYPNVNADLLLAGVLVHDIGKVEELQTPIAPSYTTGGQFIGHILYGTILVDRAIQITKSRHLDWSPADEVLTEQLLHLIASHHGKLEWGAAVEPKTLEAHLLHQIDMIDSRVQMFEEARESHEAGKFHKVFPLGAVYL